MNFLKKFFSLALVLTLTINLTGGAYAMSYDTYTGMSIKGFPPKLYWPDFVDKVIDKGSNIVNEVVDEVSDTANKVIDKTGNWLKNASKDTQNWLGTASDDTVSWLEGAINDIEGFYKDISKGIKNYRKPQKPNINHNFATFDSVAGKAANLKYINVLSNSFGSYSESYNIKEKQLPKAAQDEMIKSLKDIGLSDYWSKFAVSKVSGTAEGTSIGEIVESMIPLDFLLMGSIADVIDKIVEKYGYEIIDLNKSIQPLDTIDRMEFTYKIKPIEGVSGPAYVKFYGISSLGFRDSIKGEFISGGKTYSATPFVENNMVGFFAKVDDISDLSFRFINEFDAPVNVGFEIADGIQDTINNLSPLGDPISNSARDKLAEFLGDKSAVYEKTVTDDNGNKKKTKKDIPSVNEIYANGDVGVIVMKAIYQIPIFGDIAALLFKSTGNDAVLENIIRDVVNQKEVNSFIRLTNPVLMISSDAFSIDSSKAKNFEIQIDNKQYYNIKYFGSTETQIINVGSKPLFLPEPIDAQKSNNYEGQLFLVSDDLGNPVSVPLNSKIEMIYKLNSIDGKSGNAGLVFGVTDVKLGNDQYKGHYLGLVPNESQLAYGTANFNWSFKENKEFINIEDIHKLTADIKLENGKYMAYVSIDGLSYGSIELKDFTDNGYFGARTWNCNLSIYNLSVISGESVTSNNSTLAQSGENTLVNEGSDTVQLDTSMASAWAIKELDKASKNNLVAKRVSNNLNKDITRAEFAALTVKLYEAMTHQTVSAVSEDTFTDTDDIDARKAAFLKIVQGSNGQFRPNDKVTRQEMAIMYYKALDSVYKYYGKEITTSDGKLSVSDKDIIAPWAASYVDFVFDNGIITGSENKFNPLGNAPREQALVVLNRVFEKYYDILTTN